MKGTSWKTIIVIFIASALVAAIAQWAFGEEDPLAPYAIGGFGMCGLQTEDGQKLAAPCAVMSREGESEPYFAIFSDDGEELLLIIQRTSEGGKIVWSKPDAQ